MEAEKLRADEEARKEQLRAGEKERKEKLRVEEEAYPSDSLASC